MRNNDKQNITYIVQFTLQFQYEEYAESKRNNRLIK